MFAISSEGYYYTPNGNAYTKNGGFDKQVISINMNLIDG